MTRGKWLNEIFQANIVIKFCKFKYWPVILVYMVVNKICFVLMVVVEVLPGLPKGQLLSKVFFRKWNNTGGIAALHVIIIMNKNVLY